MTEEILEYIRDAYGVEPEYLWSATPTNAALRNSKNGKWFGVLLGGLDKSKLAAGLSGKADVLNLKCDPMLSFSLIDGVRIFPGYHMNKEHWISVLLDGSLESEELRMLVDISYELVLSGTKR